ncbi:MAG: LLM class flavin-dependent oxidoreductase, partial [Dehalococcoidia bacterium]|nr:LLM class flavin-dependent oxidoreductase [Dehalococcoidia bacterium]
GVGRGHSPLETALLCPAPDRSVDLFNDAFAILKHAFRGEPFQFEGAYWRFPRVQLLPPPTQRAIRLHMVMTSPRSIAFAAQEGATPIVGNRSPAFIKEQLDQYLAFAREAGKSEDEIADAMDGVSASRYVAYADSREEAREQAALDLAHYGYAVRVYDLPVGDPAFHNDIRPLPPRELPDDPRGEAMIYGARDDVIEQLRDLERVGVRNLNIRVDSPITPPEEAKRRLIRFTEDVLPHLQQPVR